MRFDFDYTGRYEYPILELCNPDFTQLSMITQITKDLKFKPRFNAVSDLSFKIYSEFNGTIIPYWEKIRKNRLIHMEGVGYFVIINAVEYNDGGVPWKEVQCYSYDYTLNYKGINLLDGTYKFYDPTNVEQSLLSRLIQVAPLWKIGHVDSELWGLYRTFDIPDANLYGFLQNEVSQTYEAIFEYDIENLIINVYAPKNIVKDTDVMLTFDNVLKEIKVEELSEDIYTVLSVNGADNVSIATVNPLGDSKLYNFSYYKTMDWLGDQALINKITAWENLIEQLRPTYANYLRQLKTQKTELLKLKTELRDLQSELSALELVRKNLTDQPEQLKIQTNLVNAKTVEINNTTAAITSKENQVNATNQQLTNINNQVRFDKYFTQNERIALDPYIIESVYTDENFIITDAMDVGPDANGDTLVITTTGTKKIKDLTPNDIVIDSQYIEQQLLEKGKEVLDRISQPAFTFSLDSTNFLFVEKFKPIISQIELGNSINVEITEGNWVYPVLLEMDIDYDNPTSFSMTFSNRFRLSDAEWTFAELHNENQRVASQVGSTLGVAAEPILNGTISGMEEYLSTSLNAANREIQSSSDQEVTMGSYGIRLRKKDTSQPLGYDPHQTWLNNNLIVMTDDDWQSVKLAIGFIDSPYGVSRTRSIDGGIDSRATQNKVYAVNAEVIAGRLIAGEQLVISDGIEGQPNTTFIVDRNGARLYNASFTLISEDTKSKIVLNPKDGIKISTLGSNGKYTDNLYADINGNLIVNDFTAQNIEAVSGTIGGFKIQTNRFYSTQLVYNPDSLTSTDKVNGYVPLVELKTDGTGNIGMLSWKGNNMRYEGTLIAKSGTIGGFNIGDTSIYTTDTDAKGPLLNLKSDGTGRWGLLTVNKGSASFDGSIYAKNLNDGGFNSYVVRDKFTDGAFNSSNINGTNGIISPGSINLDRLSVNVLSANEVQTTYATITSLNAVSARVGTIETNYLTADSAQISQLNATGIYTGKISSDQLYVGGSPVLWKQGVRIVSGIDSDGNPDYDYISFLGYLNGG